MIRNRGAWLSAVAGVALVAGAAWPPPPVPVEPDRNADWTLPDETQMQRLDDQAFSATIRSMRWAGQDTGGAEDGAAGGPMAWKLVGISHDPEPIALVSTGSRKADVQRVPVGATLPDGSELLEVSFESITVQADGCRSVYQPYRAQPVSTEGECADPGAAPEQRKSR